MQNNDLLNELSTNFIEYAVAVNSDRAIPDSACGLKPVARRILWGAFEKGYTFSKPHVKSAKIVGDVMGTYHPHGDSSIYGALVRLSQPWVMRYPLIDWHGSNGNIDGDGPAHMRYTEARLSKLAEDGMLFGIKKRNVDFIPNYSEDTEEPVTLPAIFPNLLCNPNTGIGVAMACNFAPHNLKEVAQAIHDYADGKEPMLPGPDFPTGGVVINSNDIPSIMRTGHGTVKIRAKYKIEKQNIIYYEIPYGTSTEALIAEIGKVAENDIPEIENIRNESNKKGLRIVVECEKGVNPEAIVKKLFSLTDLQSSFSYNQVALINKTPTEVNLKDCIEIYMNHNIECLIKELDFDLKAAEARLEIVDGLIKALEDIDNIIAFIKKSESSAAAKDGLIKEYKFTEPQAKSIVAMRLGSLAKLEKIELNEEKAELTSKIEELTKTLGSTTLQQQVILERLDSLVKKYGDARRTELTHIEETKQEKEIATVIPEDVVVILSQTGDIKRIPKASFRTQRKGGKGIKTADEAIMATIKTNTTDTLMMFTDKGKMYRILVDKLPVGTNASKGENIAKLIMLEPSEKVIAITNLEQEHNAKYVVFITKQGLVKKTLLEEYIKTKRNSGIAAINIKEGDSIANIELMNEEDLILVTKDGYSIHFETKSIEPIGRVTAGLKGIKLGDGDEVVAGIPVRDKNQTLAVFSSTGNGKKVALDEFPIQGKNGKGVYIYKSSPESGVVVGVTAINEDDSILLIGKKSICISATELPKLGRTALGNIMIKDTQVNSIVKL
jgi:DNA gyrase subunit A